MKRMKIILLCIMAALLILATISIIREIVVNGITFENITFVGVLILGFVYWTKDSIQTWHQ